MFHLRLDGGSAPEDESPSSRARLLLILLGPAPRFAEDMLERKGELDRQQLYGRSGGVGARSLLP